MDEARLLAAVAANGNPMLKWIEALATEVGMRRSEITSLKLEPVGMERRIALLVHAQNGEPRTVPLCRHAAEVVREAIARRLAGVLVMDHLSVNQVSTAEQDTALTAYSR